MEIEEITTIIDSWNDLLSENMKKYIHYKSFRNFVQHYDDINNQRVHGQILSLLSEYIDEVKSNSYDFDSSSGYDLATRYLSKLSDYYKEYAHFASFLKLKIALLWGVLGDSLLYLSHLPANYWNLPIITIVLLLYYLYMKVFKERKGRVYGLFY